MAFYHSQLRDDLLPSEVYQRIWQGLDQRLDPRAACKLMVGALALAADYDCEAALGAYLVHALERDHLPTLVELQHRYGRFPEAIPPHQ